MKHKFLDHTADIKFQAFGNSLEEVFSNSVVAMFSAMYEKRVKRKYMHSIKVKGKDLESLLYNFLEEFIFLFDSKGVLVSKVDKIIINLEKMELKCTFSGDLAKDYEIITSVKAITYNDMFIKEKNGLWVVQVVLDI
jgi:SHS2 domain-containing protein